MKKNELPLYICILSNIASVDCWTKKIKWIDIQNQINIKKENNLALGHPKPENGGR